MCLPPVEHVQPHPCLSLRMVCILCRAEFSGLPPSLPPLLSSSLQAFRSDAGTKLPVTGLHWNCGEDDPLLYRFRRTYDSNGIAVARNRETVDISDDISLAQAASIRRVSPNDGLDDDLIHHVRECEPERSGLDVHVSFPSVRPIRAESRRYGQAVGAHRPF